MNDTIECPHCHKTFPVEEALRHKIKEEFEREQKPIMWKKALAAAEARKNEESIQEIKLLKEEKEEKDKKIEEFIKNEMEIRKKTARLEEEKKEIELKAQRKLDEERKKISDESYKKAQEENRLKDLEHQKKESDYLKQIEELKRKMQQGSQQLQGEVLELELENLLKREFPYDEIKEVPKGVKGADIQQVVKNNFGKTVGIIVWESKRTKAWSEGWIAKLREDQRILKADVAVLISQVLPEGVRNFVAKNEVWVCNYDSFLSLAIVLRDGLIKISGVRQSVVGKQDKKEILWNYLTGIEFKQRLDAINEAIVQREKILEKEQKWFINKWAAEKKSLELLKNNLIGATGDLQAIMGKSAPELKEMKEFDELESGEKNG